MMRSQWLQFGAAILLLLVVVVGYAFWYVQVDAESASVGSIQSQIVARTQDTTRAAVAKSELESLTADENSVEQYFVSTNDVVPFLESIQSLGKFLGAKVSVVSVSATPGAQYGQLNLSLKITGSFNAVARTIGAIEYGPYDTTLSALTLDADLDQNQVATTTTPSWTATANFSVGTQPVQTSTPASTPSITPTSAPVATPVTPVSEPSTSSQDIVPNSASTSSSQSSDTSVASTSPDASSSAPSVTH